MPPTLHVVRKIEAIIDELGEARRLKSLWQPQVNPHLQREAELVAELAARFADLPADEHKIVRATAYELAVTPREFRQKLEPEHELKALAAMRKAKRPVTDAFSTTLTALRKVLGQPWLDTHVPKFRTGPREYRVTPIAPATPAKAA